MASLTIRQYGDPVLKERTREVEDIDGALASLVESMIETMYAAPGTGSGGQPGGRAAAHLRLRRGRGARTVINPRIVESDGEWAYDEGCLSVPGLSWEIVRPNTVHLVGLDLDGNEISIEASELEGRVFQHELDHLDGILLVERLDEDQRKEALKILRSRTLDLPASDPDGLANLFSADAVPTPERPARLAALPYGERRGPPGLPRHPGHGGAAAARARRGGPRRRPLRDATRPPTWSRRTDDPEPGQGGGRRARASRSPTTWTTWRRRSVELAVVVAFGRIIPARLLEQVPMVNLHFSLLPRWRGAAPVERAILAGRSRNRRLPDEGRGRHSTPAPSTQCAPCRLDDEITLADAARRAGHRRQRGSSWTLLRAACPASLSPSRSAERSRIAEKITTEDLHLDGRSRRDK